MCCLVLLLGFLGPRVVFVLTWLFSDRVEDAFGGNWFLPLAGVILLPWTSLAFIIAWAPPIAGWDGLSGFGWVLVVIGALLDLSTYSGGARRRQNA